MRITFILPRYMRKPMGGANIVYTLSHLLAKKGHHVSVVHPRILRNIYPEYPKAPLSRIILKTKDMLRPIKDALLKPVITWQSIDKSVSLLYIPELKACHIPDGDIVIATSWHTAEYMAEYPPSKGRKFYYMQSYESWLGPKDRVDRTWHSPFKKIVIAKWLFDKGIELGVPPSDMRYIPLGFDFDKYRTIKNIAARKKRIAMMYSSIPLKGATDGITALKKAHDAHPDITAVLFGLEERPKDLPSWITYYRNPSQEFLVEEIYNGSSIYLCPSWTEGFHLPPAEAMACGLALVTTDIDGVSEYAKNEVTALMSPPKDPEMLAKNLLRLLSDDRLRIQLALEGNKAIKRFSWDATVKSIEDFLSAGKSEERLK